MGHIGIMENIIGEHTENIMFLMVPAAMMHQLRQRESIAEEKLQTVKSALMTSQTFQYRNKKEYPL